MKRWLIKQLGGITKQEFDRLYAMYLQQNQFFKETIEQHNMQGAWQQVKDKYKIRSIH